MYSLNLVILLLVVLNFYSVAQENKDENSIFLLHVIMRHGERTPDSPTYPNDPFKDETYYPFGNGQLTTDGKKTSYNIGKYLRKKYENFLGDVYTKDNVEAITTDTDRTKMSLQLVLASLYPIDDYDMEQFIPYDYVSEEQDELLANKKTTCPRYMVNYIYSLHSPETLAMKNQSTKLYNYLSNHTGAPVNMPIDAYLLYFILKSQEDYGLTLPVWTKSVWPDNLTNAVIEENYISTANAEMIRLTTGPLLAKIISDTYSKMKGDDETKNKKIYLYSGHEHNISYMLMALKVFYPHVASDGSNIIFEVYKDNDRYSIKVLYQDHKSKDYQILQIPGCDLKCPIDRFADILKEHIATEADSCFE